MQPPSPQKAQSPSDRERARIERPALKSHLAIPSSREGQQWVVIPVFSPMPHKRETLGTMAGQTPHRRETLGTMASQTHGHNTADLPNHPCRRETATAHPPHQTTKGTDRRETLRQPDVRYAITLGMMLLSAEAMSHPVTSVTG